MKCVNYELIEQYAKNLKDGDDPIEKALEMYKYAKGIIFDGVPIDTVLEILDEVSDKASAGGEYWNAAKTVKVLRRRIMALKRGEQE